jgi:hypothetical protein
VTVTSDQLATAADRLRSTAALLDAGADRHHAYGRALGTSFGDVSHAWSSPQAERFIQQGLGLAVVAGHVPAGLEVGAAALRTLASTASSLATELAGLEAARDRAATSAAQTGRLLAATDADDTSRLRTLGRQRDEARAVGDRAAADIAALAERWTSACRSAAAGVRTGTGQVHLASATITGPTLGPPVGPVAGPAPSGGPGAADVAGWGWNFVATPAILAFNERARTHILHLAPRPAQTTTVVRAYEQRVVRRGHWRNPPRLRPGSPLAGTVRHPTWVRPVLGPVQVTERVVRAPAGSQLAGVAARVELPRTAWGSATRALGPVSGVATVGVTGYQEFSTVTQREDLTGAQQTAHVVTTTALEGGGAVAGGIGGAKVGAMGGAAIGTAIFPGVGTAVGAVGGAVVGGIAGSTVGQKLGAAASDGLKKLNPRNLFGR